MKLGIVKEKEKDMEKRTRRSHGLKDQCPPPSWENSASLGTGAHHGAGGEAHRGRVPIYCVQSLGFIPIASKKKTAEAKSEMCEKTPVPSFVHFCLPLILAPLEGRYGN